MQLWEIKWNQSSRSGDQENKWEVGPNWGDWEVKKEWTGAKINNKAAAKKMTKLQLIRILPWNFAFSMPFVFIALQFIRISRIELVEWW